MFVGAGRWSCPPFKINTMAFPSLLKKNRLSKRQYIHEFTLVSHLEVAFILFILFNSQFKFSKLNYRSMDLDQRYCFASVLSSLAFLICSVCWRSSDELKTFSSGWLIVCICNKNRIEWYLNRMSLKKLLKILESTLGARDVSCAAFVFS